MFTESQKLMKLSNPTNASYKKRTPNFYGKQTSEDEDNDVSGNNREKNEQTNNNNKDEENDMPGDNRGERKASNSDIVPSTNNTETNAANNNQFNETTL